MTRPPAYVLLHSPALGPASWAPVASSLRVDGRPCVVPALRGVLDGGPPYEEHLRAIGDLVAVDVPTGEAAVLLAHSGAGLFVPFVADRLEQLGRRVAARVLVDAVLPPPGGAVAVAPPELLDALRPLAREGRLPPWTDWWGEADVAPLFPDRATRAAVSAEQPRLPLAYYESVLDVPAGWDAGPCAYVRFSPAYADEAADALLRGWRVEDVPGGHLHQLVAPGEVAERITGAVAALT